MERSQTIAELAKALAKFQSQVAAVKKDASNPFFKSKYATLENIIETIRKPLEDSGLSFSQFPSGDNELVTILMHISGEFLQSTAKMTPKDQTPQSQGSAITYLRRYALSAILGIATEEDDDGNQATHKKTAPQKPKMPPRKSDTPKAEPVDQSEGEVITIDGLGDLPAPDGEVRVCVDGAELISEAEYEYSKKWYGKPLCRTHQAQNKRLKWSTSC